MKLRLVSRGGIAAAIALRSPPAIVETSALPEEDAAHLRTLIEKAKAAPSSEPAAKRTPDAMSYTIEVEEDGRVATLRGSDTDMSPEFSALLERVQRILTRK
jgi:hypothetical protein